VREFSANTQAVLLLTAPLLVGKQGAPSQTLNQREYQAIVAHLHQDGHTPADLIAPDAEDILSGCEPVIPVDRLKALLQRGLLLSQCLDQWSQRNIWVISRADPAYPSRYRDKLKNACPPVLYGCGDLSLLESGGLAVVGSRNANESLISYTEGIGRLAAESGTCIVSGAARGVDQAAMRGALEGGGAAIGILADSLERAALQRENREFLQDGRLLLLSAYDPKVGFDVGRAMGRNRLIYGLSDAALVVCSDQGKGGTWAGAVEVLDKLRLVPVYVRAEGSQTPGLRGLIAKGAMPFEEPTSSEAIIRLLQPPSSEPNSIPATTLPLFGPPRADSPMAEQSQDAPKTSADSPEPPQVSERNPNGSPGGQDDPRALILEAVRIAIERQLQTPRPPSELAEALGVREGQIKDWLKVLVSEGVVEKKRGESVYRLRRKLALFTSPGR